MAKVVLIWNEHPTEVVAGFHARKVAKILKEKYGHKVVMEKVPTAETNYGIVSNAKTPREAAVKLLLLFKRPSIEIARKYAQRHNAQVFNFHASPATQPITEVRIKEHQYPAVPFGRETDIYFESYPGTNHYIVEVPGLQVVLPARNRKKRSIKIIDALAVANRIGNKKARQVVNTELNESYQLYRMPLNHPKQQKYLHRAISEKIAAAIHERISRK